MVEPSAPRLPCSADLVLRISRRIIDEQHLTALMVTHSLQQAVRVGHRVIMMHGGRIIDQRHGAEKQRLRTINLEQQFDEARKRDMTDEAAAALLQRLYL